MVVHAGAGAIEVVGVAAEIQEARSGPIQRRTKLLSKVLISHAPLRTQVDHALSPSETEKLSVEILMGKRKRERHNKSLGGCGFEEKN